MRAWAAVERSEPGKRAIRAREGCWALLNSNCVGPRRCSSAPVRSDVVATASPLSTRNKLCFSERNSLREKRNRDKRVREVMETTNWARLESLPESRIPIGVSLGIPNWFEGERREELAPREEMFGLNRENFLVAYRKEILEKLVPEEVWESCGGEKGILICWESPFLFCHRRMIAEWLEESLDRVIPERGFSRDLYPKAGEMSFPSRGEKSKERKRKEGMQLPSRNLPKSFDLDFFGGEQDAK